jgi:MFS family permease
MGGVAAPLLAGFAVTLAGLVITAPKHFRWQNATLVFLSLAAFALVAALQFTFRARQFAVTPREMADWWPDAYGEYRQEELRWELREHRREYKKWANLARYAYNFGLLAFAAGFTCAIIPRGSISGGRLAAIILAIIAVIAEACWIANDVTVRRRTAST